MIIFELVLYACVTSAGMAGAYSKTCDWHSRGEFYASKERCEEQGKQYRGADVMRDVVYANATNRYENVNCVTHQVIN